MTNRNPKPIQLNDLGIYIPMERKRGVSPGWRMFLILVALAIVVGVLAGLSQIEAPQI